ncbi:MAG: site-specific integrase [Bacteroidales bacterium]|nr:site-specific integrase [Bacteroidales bacterium]
MLKISYKLFLRKNAQKLNGTFPIYLQVTINRKSKYFSCSVDVHPDQWDPNKQRVKKNHPRHYEFNTILTNYENKAGQIKIDCFQKEIDIDIERFGQLFNNKSSSENSFLDYAIRFVDHCSNNNFAPNTIRTYKTDINKLYGFQNKISFENIDIDFFENYRRHLINVSNNSENSIQKAFKFIKTVWYDARKNGFVKNNPFDNWKIKAIKGDRAFLDLEELRHLQELYSSGQLKPRIKNVLTCFLFSCHTGIRHSDIKGLRFKHLIINSNQNPASYSIKFNCQKTSRTKPIPLSIPLSDFAQSLLGPVPPISEVLIFKVPTNQVVNRYLKEIQEISGINKTLTFHVARHTCATVLLNLGASISVIADLLGHTELKTTQIYAKILPNTKIAAINKLNDI